MYPSLILLDSVRNDKVPARVNISSALDTSDDRASARWDETPSGIRGRRGVSLSAQLQWVIALSTPNFAKLDAIIMRMIGFKAGLAPLGSVVETAKSGIRLD